MKITVQHKTIIMDDNSTSYFLILSKPICVPKFFTTDNREKGSTIKFDIDSKGKNCIIEAAVLLSGNILKVKIPLMIPSIIFQTNRNPSANAERLTNIPKNRQKEKKPTNFMKYANKYSKSEKIMPNSVYEEKLNPKMIDIIKTKIVDTVANKTTVRNLD